MMSPEDPRHGTRAGYQAHRRAGQDACDACLHGRAKDDKRVRFDHHRGVRMEYTSAEVRDLLAPWLAMGLSYGAIGNAAGMGGTHGSRLGERVAAGHPFRRGTYLALTQVTEARFNPLATVYADLTRTRIFSLMAAGHPLRSMPILETGQWRHRRNVTVEQAADIRDHYAAHQEDPGGSVHTASRARNSGHLPPAAWDDPGTLAWPLGWTSILADPVRLDEVTVLRILDGDWRAPATKEEKIEVTARWRASGRSLYELEKVTGWNPQRYYTPDREQAAS